MLAVSGDRHIDKTPTCEVPPVLVLGWQYLPYWSYGFSGSQIVEEVLLPYLVDPEARQESSLPAAEYQFSTNQIVMSLTDSDNQ
jgi:hypothetical protein